MISLFTPAVAGYVINLMLVLLPQKHVTKNLDLGNFTNISNFRQTAKNYNIIRFADVLLMAAEAEIEAGSLIKAKEYINRVRTRAKNPAGFVPTASATQFNPSAPVNYRVEVYTASFADQATARKAVRFERRLSWPWKDIASLNWCGGTLHQKY